MEAISNEARLNNQPSQKVFPLSRNYESAWECVKRARMQNRPQAREYMDKLFENHFELKGDRCFGDDSSIITSIAWFDGIPVTVIGQQKGHTLPERMTCNFGMPHPEGYRKSIRALRQAEKFNRPVICFVDTPGAFCGVEAEERGQGLIIAQHLNVMATLKVPVISVIIGEGGSGGALALTLSDRLIMLENSYFSVISPEGCASILFKDSSLAPDAADSLKLTAKDLYNFEMADYLISENENFCKDNMDDTIFELKKILEENIRELRKLSSNELIEQRHTKYLQMKGCS